MYNRYIPGSNGIYERRTVHEPQQCCDNAAIVPAQEDPTEQASCVKSFQPRRSSFGGLSLDTGDLLLLCIVLLLMIDSDGEDTLPILITAVAFLFMQ